MDTLISKLAAIEKRARELESTSTQREKELAAAQEELEHRARLLTEKATQIHQQSERITQLEAEHSTLASRLSALTAERDALAQQLDAKSTLLDVLTTGRVTQDKQMEGILSENKNLVVTRDALQLRVSELERAAEQMGDRFAHLDEEFGKAEGQLEIIKDIFLRETIR